MNDYIVRATAGNAQIRAFAAVTTNLVEEAREHHGTSPVATAALGRLLTGGVMMGSMMKNDTDMLTIQIQCSGQIEGLTVTADSKGNVKGYAFNPDVMLPAKNGKLDVGGALGQGVMTIIKDMGLKEPYSGQTILQTGEIAEDLTYYFATSEQVPSSVGLGVLMNKDNTVKCAGGFIVQVMPFIEDEVLNKLEANIQKIQSVTSMLDNGHTPEQMLEQVLEGLDLEITDTMPAQFYCNCSKKRIEKAIISIGKKEIQEMIDEGIDAIFLAPVDWQAITPALEALKKADVKIINIDTQVAEMDYVDAYIGSDNKSAGVQCGENLVQRFPDGGKIAILECPSMNSINERISGFEETIAGKGFEVVAREDVAGDLTQAREASKKILAEHPDITAIMCGNDQIAVGACVAANEAANKTVSIYGVDGSPEIKKELEKNSTQVVATAAQSPIKMGKEAVKIALNILNGESFERETYLETYLITKDNVEMYGSDGWQ